MPERLRSFANIANGYEGKGVVWPGLEVASINNVVERQSRPFSRFFSTKPKETFCAMFAVKPYTCAEVPK
jgi:hypothetical protein